ncbi:MAG TPA: hypothetical protein PKY59_02670 [Pyrinomonadaceae bacterium]|nr:hypothetical protein [Pyrinomonadaceae bacterium]
MKNLKANRAERPDKALFNAMMGVFFLLFAFAPAYWAFYNFGEYRSTTDFIEELSKKNDQTKNPEVGQEYGERKTVFESRAKRYRLEMLLSGAGAFILFGISALLFIKALKSRGKKNIYEEIDASFIPPPNTKIEVKYTNFQSVLLGGLIAFFSLMSALIFYQTLKSPFSTQREIIVKAAFSLFLFAIVLFIVFLQIRAKRNSVKTIDSTGVTSGGGRHFPWNRFCGVITQTALNRFMKRYIWREELAFSGGETVWIIPQRIKNYGEVSAFISQLPKAVLKNSN